MSLEASELILNEDQSIYHLNLHPEDISETIILVGDPARVARVSACFDSLEIQKSKREFVTHTGWYKGKRLSVVSTGIGTDTVDIVLNELDALVNIDFQKKRVKKTLTRLNLIRLGTSGSIQPDIAIGSIVLSELAIGFDGLLQFYDSGSVQMADVQFAFMEYSGWSVLKAVPYVVQATPELSKKLDSEEVIKGFTATNPGFYGPQGRSLRLGLEDPELNKKLTSFRYKGKRITNMEMETAGIFGLAALLGHAAASVNCILANRPNRTFSSNPSQDVDRLIRYTLDKLTS
ncbi:MAG: phosphorylase [Bacteroidetes bacterium]|jgi:uridine phosphorylase|nr:MAG: phosphorylase [Bacteroidota bacterium]UCE68971.1 MAG: nucleoside phosphorylase [Flavobacteriaceae bacterium]